MSLSLINICNCYHYALFLFCVELRFLRSTYIYILEKLGTSHLGRLYLGHTFPSAPLLPQNTDISQNFPQNTAIISKREKFFAKVSRPD